ncbi:MAG: hypothetical protein LBT42_03245 [Tannerella sp.]|nr:hypothetical protein [Tannerella sp.]
MQTEQQPQDTAHIQARFDEMYRQFFKSPAEHFYEADSETILDNLEAEGRSNRDTVAKAQMLSELLYRDALLKTDVTERCLLLEKALYLLEYIDGQTKTYSWEQGRKMSDIRKLLTQFKI